MKRVGQALETRILIDGIFDQDASALIVVCGDFNADLEDVPVQAIRGDVENTGRDQTSRAYEDRLSAFHLRRGPRELLGQVARIHIHGQFNEVTNPVE